MKNATLRQLKVFEAVARHLSYSRAAEELHLSQPAVSIQVGQIEAHAGLQLFERLGRKVYLTAAGDELLQHSRAIIEQFKAAEEALQALKGLRGGRLTVAVISTAQYFAPQLLAQFCRRHPEVQLRLEVSNREAVIRHLQENSMDLAIMGRPPEGMETVAEPFARHPHAVLAAPAHPLAGRAGLGFEELPAGAFIVREPGSGTRIMLDELFARRRLPFTPMMEMNSNETIKQAVMAGMGVSFLSLHTTGLELATRRLAMLDVKGLPVMRKWYVVHRQDKRLSPAAAAFRAFLLEEGARGIEALMQGVPDTPSPARRTARAAVPKKRVVKRAK